MGVRETYRDCPHIKAYQRRLNLSSGGGGSVEKQAARQDLRDEKEKLRTLTKIRRSDADQARVHKKRSHETKIGRGKDDLSHDEVI